MPFHLFAMSNLHRASDSTSVTQRDKKKPKQTNHSDGFVMFYCNTNWFQVNNGQILTQRGSLAALVISANPTAPAHGLHCCECMEG